MSNNSFDDRDGMIWLDGQLVDWRSANIHVLTHALHYASAVFEGERVYGGNIFALSEHSQRLIDSAQLLDFTIPWSREAIDEACHLVVKTNGISDGYLRPIAWRGSEMMGVSAPQNKIHLGIAVWQWPNYFSAEAKMKGLRLAIADWRRPDPMTAPCRSKAAGLYMICTLSKHKAEREGFNDAMMLDWRGYVAEATGANIFFLMNDGKLHTPLADCFLNGITRRTVIRLAKSLGYEVVERHILPEELKQAHEAFLTGTAVEVTPIAEIGPYHFTPARCCQQLISAYEAEVRRPS